MEGIRDSPGSLCSHWEYTVMIGDVHLTTTSKMAVHVPVKDIVIHQNYRASVTIQNDIALALLEFPVNYSSHIQPVCFPEQAFMVQAGTKCWVTGWGKVRETGETVKEIQPREGAAGALGLSYRLKGDTGRQFSSK